MITAILQKQKITGVTEELFLVIYFFLAQLRLKCILSSKSIDTVWGNAVGHYVSSVLILMQNFSGHI